jgi:hypothetical protein
MGTVNSGMTPLNQHEQATGNLRSILGVVQRRLSWALGVIGGSMTIFRKTTVVLFLSLLVGIAVPVWSDESVWE